MANITNFNVSDVSLYFQALALLSEGQLDRRTAHELVRKRLVTYMERRRAVLSLPPLRGEMSSLGEKLLLELRQMDLAVEQGGSILLTTEGREVASALKRGEGRVARLALLARLIDTYDNARAFVTSLTSPKGKPLILPMPRNATAEELDDDDADGKLASTDLNTVCAAWEQWCTEHGRLDLLPHDFAEQVAELMKASTDKRGFSSQMRNAMAQLVLRVGTGGILSRSSIYKTIRDRLSTAGALNSLIRHVPGQPLALEVTYSCLTIGAPQDTTEWTRLATTRLSPEAWVHEASVEVLAPSLHDAMRANIANLPERAGYYRIYELRDAVCEQLRISQGMFDSAFTYLYRNSPGLLTLGVDYEKITGKRLPLEIRDGTTTSHFNLVAFRRDT